MRRKRVEQDLDDEIAFHLAMQEHANRQAGMPVQQAACEARRTFGGVLQQKELCREAIFGWTDTIWQDLRYALRVLSKAPAFALGVILTFAVAVGGNTAVFSVVNSVLLRPLPYQAPEQLVTVRNAYSLPGFMALREESSVFSGLAAYTLERANLSDLSTPEQVPASRISANLFPLLGVQPLLGRFFLADEDSPGGALVAVLGYDLWQRRYHGDPGIVGRAILADGRALMVVGVLPRGTGIIGERFDLWLPRLSDCTTFSRESIQRGAGILTMIGRLRPGIAIGQANQRLALLWTDSGRGTFDRKRDGSELWVESLDEAITGNVRLNLVVVWGGVVSLLLIACANIANLLLARSTARQAEISTRMALGGSRARIFRQLMIESLLLALAGGFLALPVASTGLHLLDSFGGSDLPFRGPVTLDGYLMAYTFALSTAAGLAFAIAPALRCARNGRSAIASGARWTRTNRSDTRIRSALVLAELSISIALLGVSALLFQSFLRMRNSADGIRADHVLTFELTLPAAAYDKDARYRFQDALLSHIRAVPGVIHAGLVHPLHLASSGTQFVVAPEGIPQDKSHPLLAKGRIVSPGYFESMGIPLTRGRLFSERDTARSVPVMVVSDAFARRFFGDASRALGRRVTYSTVPVTCEIVGIVRNVQTSLNNPSPNAEFYISHTQRPWLSGTFVVKSTVAPESLARPIEKAIFALDPQQPIANLQTMDRVIGGVVARPRSTALLLGAFSLFSLALAVIGVYGVVSYTAATRSKEMAIRVALGSTANGITLLMLYHVFSLLILGIAVGLPVTVLCGRLFVRLLYGVAPGDPATLALISALLTITTLMAAYFPARRVAHLDPMRTLRSD